MSVPPRIDVQPLFRLVRKQAILFYNAYFGPDGTMDESLWGEVNEKFTELRESIGLLNACIDTATKTGEELPLDYRIALLAVEDFRSGVVNITTARRALIDYLQDSGAEIVTEQVPESESNQPSDPWDHELLAVAVEFASACRKVVIGTQFKPII